MSPGSKSKLYIFIIAALLLANIAMLTFFVWMKEPPKKGNRSENRPGNPITEILQKKVGFNEQQMSQYEKLKQQHWQLMKPMFDSMRRAKEQFYERLDDEVIPDTAISRSSEAIGERQTAMDRQIFRHFRSLRELCTEEQKPRFDSLIKGVVQRMIAPGRRGGGRQDKDSLKKDSLKKDSLKKSVH